MSENIEGYPAHLDVSAQDPGFPADDHTPRGNNNGSEHDNLQYVNPLTERNTLSLKIHS